MKVLKHINKWLHKFWDPNVSMQTRIDSHKWDNKIEILGSLSSRSHQIFVNKSAGS
jgi:hypothetical protein